MLGFSFQEVSILFSIAVYIVIAVTALRHLLRSKKDWLYKLVWVLVIIFIPIFGTGAYYLFAAKGLPKD